MNRCYIDDFRSLVAEYEQKGKSRAEAEERAASDLKSVYKLPGNRQTAWSGKHASCSCGKPRCAVCAAIAKRKSIGGLRELNRHRSAAGRLESWAA